MAQTNIQPPAGTAPKFQFQPTGVGTGTGTTGTGTGFAGFKPTTGTGFGFGLGTQQQQKPQQLQLSEVGAELIDASIAFNTKLSQQQQNQKKTFSVGLSQVANTNTMLANSNQQSQFMQFGNTSGFGQQTNQQTTQKLLTESKSNREIMQQSLIKKQQELKKQNQMVKPGVAVTQTAISQQQQQQQQPTMALQQPKKLQFRNMYGQIEFINMIQVPLAFTLADYIDIRHGYVGIKDACVAIQNERAKVTLYNIYPNDGVQACKDQCKFMGAEFISYDENSGDWSFAINMV